MWLENKLKENRYAIATFCLVVNCFLLYMGIITNDPFAVVLACLSTGLVMIPVFRNYDAEKVKQKDKRSPPGQTD